MLKQVKSSERTALRKRLNLLYLQQAAHIANNGKPSQGINRDITKTRNRLKKVDKASVHVDMPPRPGFGERKVK